MSTTVLYADNDFAGKIVLESIDPATLVATPVVAGSIRAFLVKAKTDEEAAAIAPALAVDCVYIGGNAGEEAGTWGYLLDGGDLDGDTLDAAGAATLYLVIEKAGDVRVYLTLKYVRTRPATLA